ncbi:MAG: aspartate aminotransferase family protein [Deltaproteobacteria bacterium]|nr:aspartate aminotransferase family protein [Deltaproteobacteria bacterium]MBW2201840.1 aspartate aminotransferase family protein [Deltaproteobacteria bacterium]
MNKCELHSVGKHIEAKYRRRTAESQKHIEAAQKWLPGGDTRRVSYYFPYPTFMHKGEGCYLFDCDGNKYLDLVNNYTSLIHGHAHPRVVEAATVAIKNGMVLGAPVELQYRHAEHLCSRIPSLEVVRYCNCGTEATMFAMRTARAYKGRHTILKMDGGYHGGHEFAQVNIYADTDAESFPRVCADPWIPPGVLNDILVIPFNDLDAAEDVLKKNNERIAAVMMEPCLGAAGGINPKPGYLQGMRELTRRYDVLLIYDEVMSFRYHTGGIQAAEGVQPDLTALGKIIGGGIPVGAFGGRREIMALYDPTHPRPIFHSGTFSGNSIAMAAGLATMETYDESAIERLNRLGERLARGFKGALNGLGIKAQVLGRGSTVNVHWLTETPDNAKVTMQGYLSTSELLRLFHLEMMNRGIYTAPRALYVLSTPMADKEIETAISAFKSTLSVLKPYIADQFPRLLTD